MDDQEVTEYYHRGVVCHLIGQDLAIPLDVELQRPGEGEVPAAKRLLERVFANYRRYFDAVVGAEADLGTGLLAHALRGGHVDRDHGSPAARRRHETSPSRRQWPLAPPRFSSSRTPVTSMPRSTALHMS